MKNIFLRNNNYQFRVNIPPYAQDYFDSKKVYIKSMRTNNKTQALRFSKILLKQFNFIKESIKMGLPQEQIEELVFNFINTLIEDTEADLYNTTNAEDTFFALELEDRINFYQDLYNKQEYSNDQFLKDNINKITNSIKTDLDSNDIITISKIFLDSTINNLKIIKDNIDKGNYNKPKRRKATKKVQHKLNDRFTDYIKDISVGDKWSKDTLNLNTLVGDLLILFFGENKDITTITNKDLIKFRDILFKLPNKLKQRKQFINKDLSFIINNSKDLRKNTDSTINKYITRTNQFFKYCHNMGFINKEIYLNKIKEKKMGTRTKYDQSELNLIIEHFKDINEEQQLVIKIALYSGMRLNEILQLTINDIKETEGIYYFDINGNNGKTVKNESSIRLVPIHKEILDLVLDFIKDKENNIFSYDNKDFSKWYRLKFNRKFITQDPAKVFHSFRHNFINALIQADVKGEHIASIAGHSQNLPMTFENYGSQINIPLLKEAVDKAKFF